MKNVNPSTYNPSTITTVLVEEPYNNAENWKNSDELGHNLDTKWIDIVVKSIGFTADSHEDNERKNH